MKLIHANWDTKTLGITCYEIILEEKDNLQQLLDVENDLSLRMKNYPYFIVVKTPVNQSGLLFGLPKQGYILVETAFKMILNKKNYFRPKIVERFDQYLTIQEVTLIEGKQSVYQKIKLGMFCTDRISLSPYFSNSHASQRYVNWIETVTANGGKLFEVFLKEQPVGFFTIERIDRDNVKGILAGVYVTTREMGLGLVLQAKEREICWRENYNKFHLVVSSNNLQAVRSNIKLGCEITELNYVYTKFIN